MQKGVLWRLVGLSFLAGLAGSASGAERLELDIPYEKFVLDNGLTLIVHEDHKAPIVAVNVWYHVGSKDEKVGRTGFAHLFEHLMFNGSENYNQDYFKPLEQVGATDMNGTTNSDRTNYFENVPTSALDLALWMESDRMGHLAGAISQEKLDEQRGVVQNEKRQGENQPYGKTRYLLTENTYPPGHPYSWTTIGSMEDLDAASLEDVKTWFSTYYGAANAVLAIAGDVSTQEVKKKVELYFGDIPSGQPIPRQTTWIAKMTGEHRQQYQDRVPQARIIKVWNVPAWTAPEVDYLDLASMILGSGKSSRLYKRLVHDEQLATSAYAFLWDREIGSQFYIQADARPGVDLARVETAIDEVLAEFLKKGPTKTELELVRTRYLTGAIRSAERVGGFGGKSDLLAECQVYAGTPDCYKDYLSRIQEVTVKDIATAARDWLSDGVYVLEVHPFPEYEVAATGADRTKLPETGTPPDAPFPSIKTAMLSNGLEVIFAERHTAPLVNVILQVDAGFAADHGGIPGTANLTSTMLDEGTKNRTGLQISEALDALGTRLSCDVSLDVSNVRLSAIKQKLDASLDIFADVILNPTFPQSEFDRIKQEQLAQIKREKFWPTAVAFRVLPRYLYGTDHVYGVPLSGSGTEETVARINVEDLVQFHKTWFKPNHSTLVAAGDTTLEEILPKLEKLFGGWQPGDTPEKKLSEVSPKTSQPLYLVHKPDAPQSVIIVGQLFPPTVCPEDIAIDGFNEILGGAFMSRINMNLREDKHWSYGASSMVTTARGQRIFLVFTSVQTDKTADSISEIMKEVNQIQNEKPPTADEVKFAVDQMTLSQPGNFETIGAVGYSIADGISVGLPNDYYATYGSKARALTLEEVTNVASNLLQPNQFVWVVVGDKAQIENKIREAGFSEIILIDPDGNPVK